MARDSEKNQMKIDRFYLENKFFVIRKTTKLVMKSKGFLESLVTYHSMKQSDKKILSCCDVICKKTMNKLQTFILNENIII